MLVYWLSLRIPYLDTLFFPALGAYSFLFATKSFRMTEISKIILGSFLSSALGTLFFYMYPSPISLFANALITMWMVTRFKWNAPPIVAVSLIPFFSHSPNHWFIPLSICAVMLGLMLFLVVAELIEKRKAELLSFILGNKVAAKSEKLDTVA
nr:HPP family protein [Brevibacillus choshinensis]